GRGKKRFEDLILNICRNTCTVIAVTQMHLLLLNSDMNINVPLFFVGKSVMDTVGNQIGNDLREHARVAAEMNWLVCAVVNQFVLFQQRLQTLDDDVQAMIKLKLLFLCSRLDGARQFQVMYQIGSASQIM